MVTHTEYEVEKVVVPYSDTLIPLTLAGERVNPQVMQVVAVEDGPDLLWSSETKKLQLAASRRGVVVSLLSPSKELMATLRLDFPVKIHGFANGIRVEDCVFVAISGDIRTVAFT